LTYESSNNSKKGLSNHNLNMHDFVGAIRN
jgi:hypothetical protein